MSYIYCCFFRSLIKDIHREYILENWNISRTFEKHLAPEKTKKDSKSPPVLKANRSPELVQFYSVKTEDTPNQAHESLQESAEKCTGVSKESKLLDRFDGALNLEMSRASKTDQMETNNQTNSDEILRQQDKERNKENANDSDKENDIKERIENPTERPFTKLLSLDERIDLLIAGERKREHEEDEGIRNSVDSGTSYHAPPSLATSTFTSVTSDASGSSDWYNRLCLQSLEDTTSTDDVAHNDASFDVTTSESASYWWDVGDKQFESRDFKVSVPYSNEIRRRIHLNLENDESSVHELRNQRLASHMRSVQQTRYVLCRFVSENKPVLHK